MPISLTHLNHSGQAEFVRVCGPLFEHSPWIAERAWIKRPFSSIDQLHLALCEVVKSATEQERVKLIASHPDLVGRLAREGRLTAESTAEQKAAGLNGLSALEAEAFDRYNAQYQSRFGFPFVICARQNKKEAILAAFPVRLVNHRDQEIVNALCEIYKIARLRMEDAISER